MTTQKKIDIRNVTITKSGESYGNNAAQSIETRVSSIALFINNGESKKFIDSEFEKLFDFVNFLINETK